ncbi:MAG: hypothetical protein ACYCZR_15205 [Burkholderiales bacterium]
MPKRKFKIPSAGIARQQQREMHMLVFVGLFAFVGLLWVVMTITEWLGIS